MATERPFPWYPTLAVGALVGGIVWSYWTTLGEFHERWAYDPQYSHGYLVPGFAAALLWLRREQLKTAVWQPNWWCLAFLLPASVLCLFGAWFFYPATYQLSLLPMLAGICLALGGWPLFRWAGPSIAFLVFMMPLPGRMESLLSAPLQSIGTVCSTYMLQTFGIPALADGNKILLNEVELGVVEACSGMRMLMVFFALTVAMSLVIEAAWWLRGVLILSTVPIALAANITRITLTGVLHETAGSGVADWFYHDFAGWVMILLGLGLLILEMQFLTRLILVEDRQRALPTYQALVR